MRGAFFVYFILYFVNKYVQMVFVNLMPSLCFVEVWVKVHDVRPCQTVGHTVAVERLFW